MPRTRKPRAGSMQFSPHSISKHGRVRVRTWSENKTTKLLGFAGYKAGMTHVFVNDTNPHSPTRNSEIFWPATVVECPPIKIVAIRFYKQNKNGNVATSEIFSESIDKELERKIILPKKKGSEATDFDFVRLICHTQPKLTGIGKKKPELFEVAVGGNKEQQLSYAKEKIGKEISVAEVFKEGQLVDVHAITTGKGFQGPVRRFGIQLRHHKSEKSRRNPGSLGSWRAQGQIMWRVAHAGKMGYNQRTENNKLIIKIGNKIEEVNGKGGFVKYGFIKSQYILIKGSVAGTEKRFLKLTNPTRQKNNVVEAPQVAYISIDSKQGK